MVRTPLLSTLGLLSLCGLGATQNHLVDDQHIKVFLFAYPAFWSQVAVDAPKDVCVDLDNNMIDGRVQSALVGGFDVASVMNRTDNWYCTFYDNYDCEGDVNSTLVFSAGVNDLRSANWQDKVHGILCTIENDQT
ncbi:hypothetical protein K491DRAFT_597531 [Lophiostoma macrostomum CBS 122681]|uniref:Uncharacterized protein n=1 Tax=Lophiostoma macrostomum CBS 122681 TaxID=1314788 RepID=A0A6A6TB75_9PLEO|nr:hypothetical protein K491DRAFT_597531 [Lophiostoma macrostomum CBS 122681]